MVFSGLITATGLASVDRSSFRLKVAAKGFFEGCKLGDSISVNGVCLTLIEGWTVDEGLFFVMEETRNKSCLFLKDAFEVNLEKSLSHGTSVGGHYVLGHVHGIAEITDINSRSDGSWDVWIDYSSIPDTFCKIIYKGCVGIDGISLTVADLDQAKKRFRVSLIPHTISHTIFKGRVVGDRLNIEFDTENFPTLEKRVLYVDEDFMMEAIRVGEYGRFTAPPNPWVGCVLANGGSIIGIGFHAKAGKPHAEIMAFLDAERKGNAHLIKGCTAYVTLEPCHHFGRTPPCDQEVLRRGVARCVVAIPDPDSRVDGKGLNLLQSNNIDIKVGVCQAEAEKSLAPYLHLRRTGRSYIVIKSACSLDGKIACSDGTSQWITGPESRARVHRIRAESQAIIVGSETAVTDNPMLNVRGVDFPAVNPTLETGTEVAVNEIYVASDLPLYSAGGDVGRTVKPLRVVLDARGRVTSGHLLDQTIGPTLIFTTHKAPKESLQAWEKAQVEVKLIGPGEEGGVDLKEVVNVLSSRGIIQILVEGGALIQNQFMASRLGNKLELFYGSCFIGHSGRPWAKLNFHENIKDVQFHTLESLQKLGNDVHLTYTLHHT